MNRFIRIAIILLLGALLPAVSCIRETDVLERETVPEGEPVTITMSFGADDFQEVKIGTKSEVNRADESRIHDLFVLIFEKSGGTKIYGRYFTYEHLSSSLSTMLAQENEGWYVDNLLLSQTDTDKKTRGVVKISTISKSNCQLVLVANIANTITSINKQDALDWLTSDIKLEDFNKANVTLEQNVVNRGNLFLMMGSLDVANTSLMTWDKTGGSATGDYGTDYRVRLTTLDAKVKFRIRYDQTNISGITPRYWKAFNVPDRCRLAPSDLRPSEIGTQFFNTNEAYFETTETYDGTTWQVFAFYMLETKPVAKSHADSYYKRDKKDKNDDGTNKETWEFAPQDGAYVQFDVILRLTKQGIQHILDDPETNHALTSDALFTVHLGDFTSSESGGGHDYDNYKVERGHSYTYNITIVNSKSIYIEVVNDREDESGQEGSLLLTTDEIINCDAHYEYHNMVFKANSSLATDDAQEKLSWYTKSPFAEAGPDFNETTRHYEIPRNSDGTYNADCLWVKFGINKKEGGLYSTKRFRYPGDDAYNPDWNPSAWDPDTNPVPPLIDINQLVNLLFVQNKRKVNGQSHLFDSANELRVTAFVNEYYYEKDPLTGELDADLWRKFINADPRELHILSEAVYSKDLQSDVIKSSHSIIQNSIQTFYNTLSPHLSSVWGTEHIDEMRNRGAADPSSGVGRSWSWWHGNWTPKGIISDPENGRVNTYNLWALDNTPAWDSFLDYEVDNDTPELKSNFQYMAYSCLSRNRDNNGNGVIDEEELRWYTASINQLIGMWVGSESLSLDARLYQPVDASSSDALKWRAHVVSSTCKNNSTPGNPRVIRAEEGATKSFYDDWNWAFPTGSPQEYRDRVSSVRCVRNAGTFRKDGKLADISYAPYDIMVDQYYEIPTGTNNSGKAFSNSDGTYTVTFSGLNPKSVREYTSEDLPYHDEFSLHNRVYLELNIQSRDDYVVDGSTTDNEGTMNSNITSSGYNTYCPPGYRLPNMTELLVMSNLVPASYWNQTSVTGNQSFPCRTYFSRGSMGSNKTAGETGKIGWKYNESGDRVHMADNGDHMTGIRCVRDRNMTGDITGKVIVEDYNDLHNGQETTISLNFSSMASAIRSVDMAIIWVDASGNEHSMRIDEADAVPISGVTLIDEFKYTIPGAGTGFDESGREMLPVRGWMTVRAEVTNAMGMKRVFETPIHIVSDVTTSIKLLPCDYDGRSLAEAPYQFPVLLTAYNEDNDIASWKLRIVSPDMAIRTVELGSPGTRYASTIYNYNPYEGGAALLEGTYTFQLEALCDGNTVRSEEVSMDVLHVNMRPNSEEEIAAAAVEKTAAALTGRWERELVDGLDFVAGDFIETDMDISLCEFIADPTATTDKEHSDRDLGMDDLITFGLTDIEWVPWTLNVNYPAIENGEAWVYFNPTWLNPQVTPNASNAHVGYAGLKYGMTDKDLPLHIRLEKNGLFWNGSKADYGRWGSNQAYVQAAIEKLIAANALYIGSVEGYHRSRAKYRFVRVAHNGRDSSVKGGDSNFKDDPGYGGKL